MTRTRAIFDPGRQGQIVKCTRLPSDSIAQWLEHTIADRVVPCSNHGGVFIFCRYTGRNPPINSVPNVTRAKAVTSSTTFIMKSSILLALLGFVASTYAAALTLQSPKFTVSSPSGEQIRSESYVSPSISRQRSASAIGTDVRALVFRSQKNPRRFSSARRMS